jgi:hypothetical protein
VPRFVRIRYKPTGMLLAEGPLGWGITPFEGIQSPKTPVKCSSFVRNEGAQMVKLNATIACPYCRFSTTETMPTIECQFLYECRNCHAVLRPKPGDCCVYCSYGDTPCPSAQRANSVPEV